jgi:hypothetical protein
MKPEPAPRPSLSLNWVRKPEWGCRCGFRAPTPEHHCGVEMAPVEHHTRIGELG